MKKLQSETDHILIERFEELMDAVSDDLLIADGKGTILRVSSSFESVYDIAEEKAIGRSVYDLEKEGVFKPSIVAETLKQNRKITMEQKNRAGRTIVVTSTPIRDEDGSICLVVSYSRDITEVVELQKKYANLQDQVDRYSSEINRLRNQGRAEEIVSNSRAMESVMQAVDQVADYDVNILLLGDSGVGKTTVARRIHQQSGRSKQSFVEINCAAIPETLLEAELFGYEKGAFTGADAKGKIGLIELADRGTLFLDEISEIPLALQSKILKAIQEKEIIRVGGVKPINVDFRLIAASNQDLEKLVSEGSFRKDLFYRLNVMQIRIPAIAERKDDVAPMIEHFLRQCNDKYGKNKRMSSDAIEMMMGYSWPGNVREISNVVERMYITSDGEEIGRDVLPEEIGRKSAVFESIKYEDSLASTLEKVERMVIEEAYGRLGTSTAVARQLGISQATASRKIAKYIK